MRLGAGRVCERARAYACAHGNLNRADHQFIGMNTQQNSHGRAPYSEFSSGPHPPSTAHPHTCTLHLEAACQVSNSLHVLRGHVLSLHETALRLPLLARHIPHGLPRGPLALVVDGELVHDKEEVVRPDACARLEQAALKQEVVRLGEEEGEGKGTSVGAYEGVCSEVMGIRTKRRRK